MSDNAALCCGGAADITDIIGHAPSWYDAGGIERIYCTVLAFRRGKAQGAPPSSRLPFFISCAGLCSASAATKIESYPALRGPPLSAVRARWRRSEGKFHPVPPTHPHKGNVTAQKKSRSPFRRA